MGSGLSLRSISGDRRRSELGIGGQHTFVNLDDTGVRSPVLH